MHGADFERELDVFRVEVEGATQLFYAYQAVHATMADHKEVEDKVNEASLFWASCQQLPAPSASSVRASGSDTAGKRPCREQRFLGRAEKFSRV
jgi:hypothetical protein